MCPNFFRCFHLRFTFEYIRELGNSSTSLFFRCFHLRLTFESIRELGNASTLKFIIVSLLLLSCLHDIIFSKLHLLPMAIFCVIFVAIFYTHNGTNRCKKIIKFNSLERNLSKCIYYVNPSKKNLICQPYWAQNMINRLLVMSN